MKLIAGKLNSGTTNFWNIPENAVYEIGDYAIVQNKNDYDLVKIVGIVETNEKYSKIITGVEVSKSVVNIIPRKLIRND